MNKYYKEDYSSFGGRRRILNNFCFFDKLIKLEEFIAYLVGCFLIV